MIAVPIVSMHGKLNVRTFDMQTGDILPMHLHGHDDVHITIVARGSVRCHGGEGVWEIIGNPGDLIDWQENQPHEIVAIEDGTRIINVLKYPA